MKIFLTFGIKNQKKQQILMTNETCKKILTHDPELFINKVTAKTINETIKEIAVFLGIKKHVTIHINKR